MLGKKLSEHISLKRVNCQVIGPLYLQAYSQILDMYWITSYAYASGLIRVLIS